MVNCEGLVMTVKCSILNCDECQRETRKRQLVSIPFFFFSFIVPHGGPLNECASMRRSDDSLAYSWPEHTKQSRKVKCWVQPTMLK